MNLTLIHWLAGSAILCAACFALHWLWGRYLYPLLQVLYGWPELAENEAMPLAFWPVAFIALVVIGLMAFVGHAAGF